MAVNRPTGTPTRTRVPVRYAGAGKAVQLPQPGMTLDEIVAAVVPQAVTAVAAATPTGPTLVPWQNVTNVPASLIFPGRSIAEDFDSEVAQTVIGPPGPQGAAGAFVLPLWPEDPDDPISIPGAPGAAGPAGATGAAGTAGAMGAPGFPIYLEPDLPDDLYTIPGVPGAQGPAGPTGPQGPAGAGSGGPTPWSPPDGDDYEDFSYLYRNAIDPAQNVNFTGLDTFAQTVAIAAAAALNLTSATNATVSATAAHLNLNGSTGLSFQVGGTQYLTLNNNGQLTLANPSTGIAFAITAAASAAGLRVITLGGAGTSDGVQVVAGTTSADYALQVEQAGSNTVMLEVRGDGAVAMGTSQFIPKMGALNVSGGYFLNGAPVAMSTATAPVNLSDYETDDQVMTAPPFPADFFTFGSFTMTGTGYTTNPTATTTWVKIGNGAHALVIMNVGQITGTSNATTFGATGVPANITPTVAQACAQSDFFEDNTTTTTGTIQINTGGTLTFYKGSNSSGWTASGTKQNANMVITYILN